MSFSLENILFDLAKNGHNVLQFAVIATMFIFRLASTIFALRFKGISLGYQLYPYNELKSNTKVNFLFYTLFLLLVITIVYDTNYMVPDFTYFSTLHDKCNFLRMEIPGCGITLMGLLYLKLSVNFTGFIYYDLAAIMLFVLFSVFFLLYLPIGSTIKLFKKNEKEKNLSGPEI